MNLDSVFYTIVYMYVYYLLIKHETNSKCSLEDTIIRRLIPHSSHSETLLCSYHLHVCRWCIFYCSKHYWLVIVKCLNNYYFVAYISGLLEQVIKLSSGLRTKRTIAPPLSSLVTQPQFRVVFCMYMNVSLRKPFFKYICHMSLKRLIVILTTICMHI